LALVEKYSREGKSTRVKFNLGSQLISMS